MNENEGPRAHPAEAQWAGGCNACTQSSLSVWVIRLRNTEVRLCPHCAKSLTDQLKRR